VLFIAVAFFGCSGEEDGVVSTCDCTLETFEEPIFRDVVDSDNNVVYCRELETKGASNFFKAMWFSEESGFATGLCPERAYVGACEYADLGGSGAPARDHWLIAAEAECKGTKGVWISL
jgi:hypothetical protein